MPGVGYWHCSIISSHKYVAAAQYKHLPTYVVIQHVHAFDIIRRIYLCKLVVYGFFFIIFDASVNGWENTTSLVAKTHAIYQ